MPFKCREKAKVWQKKYQDEKVVNGICAICLQPRGKNNRYCEYHLAKRREQQRKAQEKFRRKIGKGIRFPNGRPEFQGNIQRFLTKEDFQCLLKAKKLLQAAMKAVKS